MNIYLIHGVNNTASYIRLQEYIEKARKKGFEIINIDKDDTNILNLIRSNSLFNHKRLLVIRRYSVINKEVLEYINNTKDDNDIVIYFDSTIPISFIKNLPKLTRNEIFTPSKYIWKFIDSFYPGNVKNCLYYFHESLKTDSVELIFSILVGHLRDIFLVLYTKNSLQYPLWRIQKLKRAGDIFGKFKIKNVINGLADIDIKVKTSSHDLREELDLFITRKLE